MKQPDSIRIIMSGGGTGGHIFPAIAIAREIQNEHPQAKILFVGALGKMEMDKVPQAGFEIKGLPVSAFHRRLTIKNLWFPFKLMASLILAGKIVRNFKPDLVVGTGGFASGPVLRIASRRGIPTLLQEQNSYPGVTNRILARKVQKICVAYPHLDAFFPPQKTVLTGNPVRKELVDTAGRRAEAIIWSGFSGSRPLVLVFGGSLGARTLNQSIMKNLELLANSPLDVLWQTGAGHEAEAEKAVSEAGVANVRVLPFIREMELAYAAADLVVCRAGAITLSELGTVGKPAILVPLPSAAEDHQTKNARSVVAEGGAILIPDSKARERLVEEMIHLGTHPEQLTQMGERMKKLGKPDAAKEIAKLALQLMENRESRIENLESKIENRESRIENR